MLTQETKRHIDAARQVLVGVVPNPSSQIDQITNALIYKFMDDMDQSAIKAGGEPSFFVGNLERYAWTRLMDSRLGNQERMNLYSEALLKFSEAKQLPELFRGIFKSAFLPYRSPEVLGLFLKEIDYFDYSHSEELGNAYEYLLSILGSQGDAGQFRTPRHIIDFIVAAVNPAKDDKVLDPACGTAGFLVSAYKHILEQHDGKDPDGSRNSEKPLTPDQRKAIMNNFEGYDVDPGMVRISQVNMYLHQFRNPKIYNYNTLTDDERWKDKFDVILANPPFMSPKGGVSTHNKFGIPSNRSEVLFVDYFITHLRPKGRAGMIVPEGIIFQSATAPTALRKKLVEDGLYAVVSLPSGVFQPYSGVKTSILFFDNERAKQNAEILFIKVENDGFDLGATKRPINKNDLPEALKIIREWQVSSVIANPEGAKQSLAIAVAKKKIAESGDYNLSGDRYRVATDYTNAKWPMVELGMVCEFTQGVQIPKEQQISESKLGYKRYLYIQDFKGESKSIYVDDRYPNKELTTNDLVMANTGTPGRAFLALPGILSNNLFRISFDKKILDQKYLFFCLESEYFQNILQSQMKGGIQKHLGHVTISQQEIPLPPLEIQQQIVAELNGYQNIISGARQAVENWKPKIDIDPEWEKYPLNSIVNITTGKLNANAASKDGKYPFFTCSKDVYRINSYGFDCEALLLSGNNASADYDVKYYKGKFDAYQRTYIITIKEGRQTLYAYLQTILDQKLPELKSKSIGNLTKYLTLGIINQIQIPLPSLETQKQIVERIKAERALVESAKKLIAIYEQKTKDVLAKLWR